MLATRNTMESKRDEVSDPVAEDAPPRQRSRGITGWLVGAVVLFLALSIALTLSWRSAVNRADRLTRTDDLRTAALAAATSYAVDLTTYDHAKLQDQQAKLAGESTARFRATFADSMKTLGPIFQRVQASATGKVTAAAVASVDGTQARVIAFVDQVAQSTEMAKPQTQASRVSLTLVREHGRWLLDRVDLV